MFKKAAGVDVLSVPQPLAIADLMRTHATKVGDKRWPLGWHTESVENTMPCNTDDGERSR